MTVGIVTNSYPPNLNGVAICVKNLEFALLAKGAKVFIVTPKVPGVEYPSNVLPIPSLAAPKLMSKDLRLTATYNDKKIQNFFRDNGVDVIHSHDTIMGGLDAILIGNKLKIPVVHTYHTYLETYGYFNVPGYRLYIRNYSKFICETSNAVIVLSQKIGDYLTEIGVKGRMEYLPNIYVPKNIVEELKPKSQSFIDHNLLESSFNILMFGRVAKEKNILTAIEKIIPLFNIHPKLRLIIMGDGPLTPDLKEFIHDNNLHNKVLLFGSYNYTDMSQIAQVSKLYYNTSTTEVLPTTVLEAVSFGLPLICIDDSAYNYILEHGVNGLSLNEELITQVMNQLITNPQSIEPMAKAARQSYQEYLSTDYAHQYIDLYQSLIDNYQFIALPKKLVLGFQDSLEEFTENFELTKFDYWKK
jgi:1,2-diacylglycerol 3-alpha-glucosyltransferase